MDALKAHLDAGKPLVALRTCSHAFDARGKHAEGHVEWAKFDAEVLGGNYQGHHADGPVATVTTAPGAEKHPILDGLKLPFASKGSLYRPSPLKSSATALLIGRIDGKDPEPVAWVNTCKKARVFYTSLGHRGDFAEPSFVRLMENAVRWALDAKTTSEPRDAR
jgi:type 1 glutamine amidotransferase